RSRRHGRREPRLARPCPTRRSSDLTDAELTDEMRVFGLVTGQALEELPCTGLGDGADVADHFVPRHPYAVIGHAQRTAGLVIAQDRKSTRLNSSHVSISYAVFRLKN